MGSAWYSAPPYHEGPSFRERLNYQLGKRRYSLVASSQDFDSGPLGFFTELRFPLLTFESVSMGMQTGIRTNAENAHWLFGGYFKFRRGAWSLMPFGGWSDPQSQMNRDLGLVDEADYEEDEDPPDDNLWLEASGRAAPYGGVAARYYFLRPFFVELSASYQLATRTKGFHFRFQDDTVPTPTIPPVRFPAGWFVHLAVGLGGLEPGI